MHVAAGASGVVGVGGGCDCSSEGGEGALLHLEDEAILEIEKRLQVET